MNNDVILEMKNITKSFPGVKALDNINLTLKKGKVHALLGENGAGKSTLMKILSGIYKPDNGQIILNGSSKEFKGTKEAQNEGISIIHQELNLCWNLSVAANIFIGREAKGILGYLESSTLNKEAEKILKYLEVGFIDPKQLVSELSIAQQQMIEIAKAVSIDAKILIMDEPTSSLTDNEVRILFKVIKNLTSQGVAIVYISHKLEEIFEICDEVTVIRDGQYVGTMDVKEATEDKLIQMMVGRALGYIYPESDSEIKDEVVLSVKDLNKEGLIRNISFELKKGEILGFSGLVGSGRTEMAKVLFGRYKKDSGTIKIFDEEVDIKTPKDAIDKGMAFVTEDRKKEGLVLILSVLENIISANLNKVLKNFGFIDRKKEKLIALDEIKKLSIKTPDENTKVRSLSGGNQQKVILGKWLAGNPKILILDEPTRGIDVGAKSEIYSIMRELTKQGVSIIMISSELPEILGMCDRIAVMKEGEIRGIIDKEEATQELIMQYSTGGGDRIED